MKKGIITVVIICFIVNGVSAQSKDQKVVADLVNAFNKAIIETDSLTLANLVHDDLSYSHSSGLVQDKAAFIHGVIAGPNFFKVFQLADETVRISGSNAIVRHVTTAQAVNGGKPVEIKFGNLMVWQKNKGKWKLIARQGYKL